jgi:hypothetical protein
LLPVLGRRPRLHGAGGGADAPENRRRMTKGNVRSTLSFAFHHPVSVLRDRTLFVTCHPRPSAIVRDRCILLVEPSLRSGGYQFRQRGNPACFTESPLAP